MIERIKSFIKTNPKTAALIAVSLVFLLLAAVHAVEGKLYQRRLDKFWQQQQALEKKIEAVEAEKNKQIGIADTSREEAGRITNEIGDLKQSISTAERRLAELRRRAEQRSKEQATVDGAGGFAGAVSAGVPRLDSICAEYERVTGGDKCIRANR